MIPCNHIIFVYFAMLQLIHFINYSTITLYIAFVNAVVSPPTGTNHMCAHVAKRKLHILFSIIVFWAGGLYVRKINKLET